MTDVAVAVILAKDLLGFLVLQREELPVSKAYVDYGVGR